MRKKILIPFFILSAFVSCVNAKDKKETYQSKKLMQKEDSEVTPIAEIGNCYTYEIKKDTFVGLLLSEILYENKVTYYSFIISGKFFNEIPSKDEYKNAGLCGLKIPNAEIGNYTITFCKYSMPEKELELCLPRLKVIDHVNISMHNEYGSTGVINKFEELENVFLIFKKHNEETENLKKFNLPSSVYETVSWIKLHLKNNPAELAQPITIWRLNKETAHPKAVSLMKEDWFWSEIDDLSPFGNDDGADALYLFKDWREDNKNVNPEFFLIDLDKRWGMSFAHKEITSEAELENIEKQNQFYRNIDRSIIGTAFAQIALEGTLSNRLKELAIKAIQRALTPIGMRGMSVGNSEEYKSRLHRMLEILNNF